MTTYLCLLCDKVTDNPACAECDAFVDNLTASTVVCACCGKEYDPRTETKEVKQGGTRICPACWAEEE